MFAYIMTRSTYALIREQSKRAHRQGWELPSICEICLVLCQYGCLGWLGGTMYVSLPERGRYSTD